MNSMNRLKVPVLVEASERDAEDLEHEEGPVACSAKSAVKDGMGMLNSFLPHRESMFSSSALWSPAGARKLPSGGLGRGGVGQAQERGRRRGGVADVGVALVAEPVRGLGGGRKAAPQRQGRDGSRSS